jgi:hypothetical protein
MREQCRSKVNVREAGRGFVPRFRKPCAASLNAAPDCVARTSTDLRRLRVGETGGFNQGEGFALRIGKFRKRRSEIRISGQDGPHGQFFRLSHGSGWTLVTDQAAQTEFVIEPAMQHRGKPRRNFGFWHQRRDFRGASLQGALNEIVSLLNASTQQDGGCAKLRYHAERRVTDGWIKAHRQHPVDWS